MSIRVGKAMLAAVALAAALPVSSNASESEALEQCFQTFIKRVVPADHEVEIRNDEVRSSPSLLGAGLSVVDVVARGEKNGKLFGRATCVIDRDGSLVSMHLHGSRLQMLGQARAIHAG